MAYNNLLREYEDFDWWLTSYTTSKEQKVDPNFFCSLKSQIYQYFSISKYTNTFQFWAKYTNTFQKKAKYTNTKSLKTPPEIVMIIDEIMNSHMAAILYKIGLKCFPYFI